MAISNLTHRLRDSKQEGVPGILPTEDTYGDETKSGNQSDKRGTPLTI